MTPIVKYFPPWIKTSTIFLTAVKVCEGGMGGSIRDEEDPWLHDFIGRKTIMEAELQAIRLGLELTWSLDRDQVTVTTDSFEALIWLWMLTVLLIFIMLLSRIS